MSQAYKALDLANVVSSCLCRASVSPRLAVTFTSCPATVLTGACLLTLRVLTLFTLAAPLESGFNRTVNAIRESTLARKTNHTARTNRAATRRRPRAPGNLTTTSSTRPTRPPLATTGHGHGPDRNLAPLNPSAGRTGSIHISRRRPNPTVWIHRRTTRPPLADVVAMAPRPAASTGAGEATRLATRRATPGDT